MPAPSPDAAAHRCLTGRQGEALAARWLSDNGYEILQRNFRNRGGEVDIIARDGANLCFIEVKHWRRAALDDLSKALGPAKRRRMRQTAEAWLRQCPERLGPGDRPRLDVLVVEQESGTVSLFAGELDF